ncbi:Proteophosphoglycan ppg4 [Pseudohyphozyma bogoriensis]|nr:Proteophosphoglycan ppg4 [Pseudohyphozyma bogoriensis]
MWLLPGESVYVNWIGPTPGNVSVQLASNIGGPTYDIVDSYPSISQSGYCDAGAGYGVVVPGTPCGAVEFVVPAGWTRMTNYTIVVTSLTDTTVIGYTDNINITAPNTTLGAATAPAGTAVSLLAIAAPTSTAAAGATSYTGTTPVPTAITGAVTSQAANTVTVGAAGNSTSTKKTSTTLVSTAKTSTSTSKTSSTSSTSTNSTSAAAATTSTTGAASTVGVAKGLALGALGLVGYFVL